MGDLSSMFSSMTPSWGPFGATIGPVAQIGLNLAWLVAILVAGIFLVVGLMKLSAAKSSRRSDDINDAWTRIGWSAAAIVFLFAIPTLVPILATMA